MSEKLEHVRDELRAMGAFKEGPFNEWADAIDEHMQRQLQKSAVKFDVRMNVHSMQIGANAAFPIDALPDDIVQRACDVYDDNARGAEPASMDAMRAAIRSVFRGEDRTG